MSITKVKGSNVDQSPTFGEYNEEKVKFTPIGCGGRTIRIVGIAAALFLSLGFARFLPEIQKLWHEFKERKKLLF